MHRTLSIYQTYLVRGEMEKVLVTFNVSKGGGQALVVGPLKKYESSQTLSSKNHAFLKLFSIFRMSKVLKTFIIRQVEKKILDRILGADVYDPRMRPNVSNK